jgi:diguanylate cyclase (GGDEF)-like protein
LGGGRILISALVGAALLIGGLGFTLTRLHVRERNQLARQFADRAAFAAHTTGGLMASSGAQQAQIAGSQLDGAPTKLVAQLATYVQGSPPNQPTIIYGRGGAVLAAAPPLSAATARLAKDPAVAAALSGKAAMSDVFIGPGQTPMFAFAVPYATRYGRRVVLNAGPLELVRALAAGYLAAGPAVPGAHAFLIDDNGVVIVDSAGAAAGTPLRDRRLFAAARRHPSADLGRDHYASALVGSGTHWRTIFVAPASSLYAPVASGDRNSWILFGAFIAAVLAAIVAAAWTIRRSAQLAHRSAQLSLTEERARVAEQLAFERLHDELTGLPNRNLFRDRLQLALAAQTRDPEPLAVMFLDIDRFKRVNDSLGHARGDRLLSIIAERLAEALQPTDTISRFGGDEFSILCPGVHDEREALLIAQRLEKVVERGIELDGREVRVTASIGIALHGVGDTTDDETLIRSADTAMYRAKATPGAQIQVFDLELHRRAVERLDTEVALSSAIENDELTVHYQPIVDLPGGAIRGAEALVRWQRPGIGLVPPVEFIGLAEESGLILAVGVWVLGRACRDVSAWRADGCVGDGFMLSVNVSPSQLVSPDLTASVRSALSESLWPPEQLVIEITESAVMTDEAEAVAALRSLKTLGVTIAMDDFGTGQTSLRRIRRLPIDRVKLDRVFVSGSDGFDRPIVSMIAMLADTLGLTAVAEGVETAEQAQQLAELGYPRAQGFYFAAPEPEAAMRARLVAMARPSQANA